MTKATKKSKSTAAPPPSRLRDFVVWRRRPSEPTATVTAPARDVLRRPAPPASAASPPAACDGAKAKGQFFTRPKLAKRYLRVLEKHVDLATLQIVEPSAGQGAFLQILPEGTFGCDIESMCADVFTADFLTLDISSNRHLAFVGNPPFGRNAKLAIRFFNHAARQCDVIAFILPRTFRKAGTINQLNDAFHLLHEELVPPKAFIFEGRPHSVTTVFQIWVRREERREQLPDVKTHPDFEFTTWDDGDFAIQRVGKYAGRVHHDMDRSRRAHYFIKGDVEGVMRKCQSAFARAARNTAGYPSLSMGEIVSIYGKRASRDRSKRRNA